MSHHDNGTDLRRSPLRCHSNRRHRCYQSRLSTHHNSIHGRWRRPVGEDNEEDSVECAGVVAISSFSPQFCHQPTVATDKVACPPAFSILLNTSRRRVSSSPILASDLKYESSVQEHRNYAPLTFTRSIYLINQICIFCEKGL